MHYLDWETPGTSRLNLNSTVLFQLKKKKNHTNTRHFNYLDVDSIMISMKWIISNIITVSVHHLLETVLLNNWNATTAGKSPFWCNSWINKYGEICKCKRNREIGRDLYSTMIRTTQRQSNNSCSAIAILPREVGQHSGVLTIARGEGLWDTRSRCQKIARLFLSYCHTSFSSCKKKAGLHKNNHCSCSTTAPA